MSQPVNTFVDPIIRVIDDVIAERERQRSGVTRCGDTNESAKTQTRNDWIAMINAYAGRAADKVPRNRQENCDFRGYMVKAAALIVAALEAHDQGFC